MQHATGAAAAGVAHEINNPIGFVSSYLGSLAGYVQNLLELLAVYEKTESSAGERQRLSGKISRLKETMGIVEKHHGKIEVESEVGTGTTFRLWLPVTQQVGQEQAAGEPRD